MKSSERGGVGGRWHSEWFMQTTMEDVGKVREIPTVWRTLRHRAHAFLISSARIFRNSLGAFFCMMVLAGGTALSASSLAFYGVAQNPSSMGLGGWRNDNSRSPGQRGQSGQRTEQHLGQWLRHHQNLPLEAQEHALRKEPGFNRLPPAVQQRLIDRLRQLHAMPPAQRERTLQWMEALEKLSPEQRQKIHNTMQQVGELPPARQRMLSKASRDLSEMPPDRRQTLLESPEFKGQFSDQEREILKTLMSVQPYTPPQQPGNHIEDGGKQ